MRVSLCAIPRPFFVLTGLVFLIAMSAVTVYVYESNSSSTALSYNTNDTETSAEKLIKWWFSSVQNETSSYGSIIQINKTRQVLRISPPTCCWPLFYATSKSKCLLLEIHIAYCAARKDKKCTASVVQRQCAISGLSQPPGYTCDNTRICCKALTASCLSCSYGVPVDSLCKCIPTTPGC